MQLSLASGRLLAMPGGICYCGAWKGMAIGLLRPVGRDQGCCSPPSLPSTAPAPENRPASAMPRLKNPDLRKRPR